MDAVIVVIGLVSVDGLTYKKTICRFRMLKIKVQKIFVSTSIPCETMLLLRTRIGHYFLNVSPFTRQEVTDKRGTLWNHALMHT